MLVVSSAELVMVRHVLETRPYDFISNASPLPSLDFGKKGAQAPFKVSKGCIRVALTFTTKFGRQWLRLRGEKELGRVEMGFAFAFHAFLSGIQTLPINCTGQQRFALSV